MVNLLFTCVANLTFILIVGVRYKCRKVILGIGFNTPRGATAEPCLEVESFADEATAAVSLTEVEVGPSSKNG